VKNLIFAVICLLLVIPCQARIITVDDDGPADFNNIPEAMDASEDGDIIEVQWGTYTQSFCFNGRAITVKSVDPNDPTDVRRTIISVDSGLYSVSFDFGEGRDSVLMGFTVKGRGIYCNGSSPTISHNTITNCSSRGIDGYNNASPDIFNNDITFNAPYEAIYDCDGPITDNEISNNGGGLYYCDGPVTGGNRINYNSGHGLYDCDGTISGNNVQHNTGYALVDCAGPVTNNDIKSNGSGLYQCGGPITGNTINDNDGDGIYDCNGPVTGNTINNNDGHGIYDCNGAVAGNQIINNDGNGVSDCNASVTGNTINNNNGYGINDCNGAVSDNYIIGNEDGILNCLGPITDNNISDNNGVGLSFCGGPITGNEITDNNGIGLYRSDGPVTYNTISGNNGVGLYYCAGPVTYNTVSGNIGHGLYDCNDIRHNTISDNQGSGLYLCFERIEDNIITGNTGANWGGGLARCTAIIVNNVISDNEASWQGGGLYLCTGTIANNEISGNTASDGGGLYQCNYDYNEPIINNVISGNIATTGNGGGFYACNSDIINNTIVGNRAEGMGGGIYMCDVTIKNNIIAFNRASHAGAIYGNCSNSFNCYQCSQTGGGSGCSFGGGAVQGPNDTINDPCFAVEGYWDVNDMWVEGEYHLKSEIGRWDPNAGGWVADDVTSPCIDGGDPYDSVGYEPHPNGDIINQGAYGGTQQASKSPYGWVVYCTEEIPGDISVGIPRSRCKVDFDDLSIMASFWLEVGDVEPDIARKWVARYDGVVGGSDSARAIAIDSSGNLCVTGRSKGSGGDYDYVTVKYDPDKTKLWVARYDGPANSYDSVRAIAIDSDDSVYVTGYSEGAGGGYDYATVKYDPGGNELWVARYNGPGNHHDYARAITIDGTDNVYVTGESKNSEGDLDYTTIKYDLNGNELWPEPVRYNGPGNHHDYARAIAIDSADNAYVTGYSKGSAGTDLDYATIKYGPGGSEIWVARYNGLGNGLDYARAIAIDSADNVYVTGYSKGPDGDFDYATIKYGPGGNELWVARYDGTGNYDDCAYAIAIDSNDNIYVTGESKNPDGNLDYATIKYEANGNELWVARYDGPGDYHDSASSITIDGSGDVYVTGQSTGSGGNFDYATIRYCPDSSEPNEPVSVKRYNGKGKQHDYARAIAIDGAENVYVTGESMGSDTGYDYATVKYSPVYICTIEITGDLNDDCRLDFVDFAILAGHWLECNLDPPEACWWQWW